MNSDDIIEYNSDDSTFRFNKATNVLHIKGISPKIAKPIILQMIREKWIPSGISAIWFSGNPVRLISGVNTTIYLTAKIQKPKPPDRSFADIVNDK